MKVASWLRRSGAYHTGIAGSGVFGMRRRVTSKSSAGAVHSCLQKPRGRSAAYSPV